MIFPSVVVAGGRVEATYTDMGFNPTDSLPTYTFTGVNFGAEHARRYMVVYATVSSSSGSVTIGGVAATGHSDAFWIAPVPTGTSGTVVINTPSLGLGMNFVAWSVVKLRSATPVAFATNALSATPSTIPIDAVTGGCILGVALGNGPNISWTSITEDAEMTVESSFRLSAATHHATASENRSIGISTSGAGVPTVRLLSLR